MTRNLELGQRAESSEPIRQAVSLASAENQGGDRAQGGARDRPEAFRRPADRWAHRAAALRRQSGA